MGKIGRKMTNGRLLFQALFYLPSINKNNFIVHYMNGIKCKNYEIFPFALYGTL